MLGVRVEVDNRIIEQFPLRSAYSVFISSRFSLDVLCFTLKEYFEPKTVWCLCGFLPRFVIVNIRRFSLLIGILALVPAAWMASKRAEDLDVDFRSYSELQNAFGGTIEDLSIDPEGNLAVEVGFADAAPHTMSTSLKPGIQQHKNELASFSTLYGGGDTAIVNNANLPIRRKPSFDLDDFVPTDFPENPERSAIARQIIQEAGVMTDMPALEAIGNLSAYLHDKLFPHRGQPSATMNRLDGFDQYFEATSGREEVYCANQAAIYAYFANAAGIPTRLVDVGGAYRGFSLAEHAFAESFSAELGVWVYVDLQLNVAYVTDRQGNPLNGIDILISHATQKSPDLIAHVLADGGISEHPYVAIEEMNRVFIPPEATLMYLWATPDRYSVANRIVRFLFKPQPAFSLRHSGSGTYWRLFFSYLAVIGIGTWLVIIICRLIRVRQPRGEP